MEKLSSPIQIIEKGSQLRQNWFHLGISLIAIMLFFMIGKHSYLNIILKIKKLRIIYLIVLL